MSQTESVTPTTSRPTSPASVAHTASLESGSMVGELAESDDESDAVFIATAEDSSDEHITESIESTSEADWSRVRTRAQTVISDSGSDDESGTYRSVEEQSYDMMSPGQSIELQSVPSRTTGTSGSVLSLEDAQSSIDAFFTDPEGYTSIQSNKLRFWQALCVEFGLVDSSSNPLPSFSDLGIISEDTETASTTPSTSLSSNASISTATSSGPSTRPVNREANTLPPLPTSLRQAKLILENQAHVNLVDYVAARQIGRSNTTRGRIDGNGQPRNFAHLVHPSKRALIKYTRDNKKIYPRTDAKNEWLGPMLETLYGYHHRV